MEVSNEDIILFISTIKKCSGFDFTDYTEKSFRRRIEKVLSDNKFSIHELVKKVSIDKHFLEKTVRDITVNTTELLRDPKVWQTLKNKILPEFKNKGLINIWHPGCSSGQEVYSMLIMLNEAGLFEKTMIYGTDINSDVLEDAKKGVYKYQFNMIYFENFDNVFNETPEDQGKKNDQLAAKYFDVDKSKDTITIKPFLRKKPVFLTHDLVKDGNIFPMKFDMIMCRNVLIYFNNQLQNKVFDLFYNCLQPNGDLIIGIHESILGPFATKFEKKGLYYKKREIQ